MGQQHQYDKHQNWYLYNCQSLLSCMDNSLGPHTKPTQEGLASQPWLWQSPATGQSCPVSTALLVCLSLLPSWRASTAELLVCIRTQCLCAASVSPTRRQILKGCGRSVHGCWTKGGHQRGGLGGRSLGHWRCALREWFSPEVGLFKFNFCLAVLSASWFIMSFFLPDQLPPDARLRGGPPSREILPLLSGTHLCFTI